MPVIDDNSVICYKPLHQIEDLVDISHFVQKLLNHTQNLTIILFENQNIDFSQSEFKKDEDGFVNVKVEPDHQVLSQVLASSDNISQHSVITTGHVPVNSPQTNNDQKEVIEEITPKKTKSKKIKAKKKSEKKDNNSWFGNDDESNDEEEDKDSKKRLCTDCGKVYSNRKTLSKHRASMHQNKIMTYTCPWCKEEIKAKHGGTFYIHREKCEVAFTGKTDNHECKKCGEKFAYIKEYSKHRTKCLNIKPKRPNNYTWKGHTCSYEGCNYASSKKDRLENHIRVEHLNLPRIGHTCEMCGKEYAEKRYLEIHISEQHVNPDYRPFQCSQCTAAFKNKQMLNNHEQIHSDVLSYMCSYCGKGFKQSAVLYRHKLNCQFKPQQ